jgi:hypothetical protein
VSINKKVRFRERIILLGVLSFNLIRERDKRYTEYLRVNS